MDMNKKAMMMGAGLTLGSALLVTSAFADIGGAKGYEAYKEAFKATAAIDSATHRINLTLLDNGNELLNVKSEMKHNEAAGGASGQVTIAGDAVERTIQFYSQDGQQVVKSDSSDTYYLLDDSHDKKWKHKRESDESDARKMSPRFSQEMENVLDALVGNLKNYVNLSDSANGGKSIDATLTGSQIPSLVNVIGSLVVKEALSGKHEEQTRSPEQDIGGAFGLDFGQIAAHFPKLTDKVNIDEIALRADIDENNHIRNQEIDFTISGKDAAGQTHSVVLSADIEMSAVNATAPDTIDLTGKTTESLSQLHEN